MIPRLDILDLIHLTHFQRILSRCYASGFPAGQGDYSSACPKCDREEPVLRLRYEHPRMNGWKAREIWPPRKGSYRVDRACPRTQNACHIQLAKLRRQECLSLGPTHTTVIGGDIHVE